ncbi:hypothetical protein NP233_g10923 [Leucocoprinus birnbaumii]|uniref:Nephrocystin 3-like N-terminal domain-containing protein n=1 Tax=Leucocoprinus birnbaumii TaxID=56174 RepID=A0AAD5VJG1_9AGAR|nr:hypothetical protein NP233_g10923 [Leucocoprinus birnbaumii]
MSSCIEANPDIAGVGVRAATYTQNFFALLVAFSTLTDGRITKLEERTVAAQTSTILITASALLMSAFVQAKTLGVSTYHAIIILNLAWMNATNTLLQFPIFFLGQVTRRRDQLPPRHWKIMFRSLPFLFGSLHLSMLSAFGWWFWWTIDTFGNKTQQDCSRKLPIPIRILGQTTFTTNSRLRIGSLVIYTPLMLPFVNVLILDFIVALLIIPFGFLLSLFHYPGHLPVDNGLIARTYTPIYLAILTGFNIVLTVDTESIITIASSFVKPGESQWTYGQTLACFLLVLPILEFFRASAELLPASHTRQRIERPRNGKKARTEMDSFAGLPHILWRLSHFLHTTSIYYPNRCGFNDYRYRVLRSVASKVLAWQEGHILKDIALRSIQGIFSPSECDVCIRRNIGSQWSARFASPTPTARFYWLTGSPKVGKTTVMGAIAGSAATNCLCVPIFGSGNAVSDPGRLLPTIAFVLSAKDSSYCAYMQEIRRRNPSYFLKGVKEQFKVLFEIPFLERDLFQGSAKPRVILLDGLDECIGKGGRSMCEQVHTDLIAVISAFMRNHPSVPLFWVLASRQEPYLEAAFGSSGDTCFVENIAAPDVNSFISKSFSKFRHAGSEKRQPLDSRPGQEIARIANGCCDFANVALRFVTDPLFSDSSKRLKTLFSTVKDSSCLPTPSYPLHFCPPLDKIYTQVLHNVPINLRAGVKQLVLCASYRPLVYPLQRMCNVLTIDQHHAYETLQYLQSVIHIPEAEDAICDNIHFFHRSFVEFLLEPSRAGDFSITFEELSGAIKRYLTGLFEILQSGIGSGTPDKIKFKLMWPDPDREANEEHRRDLFREAREFCMQSLTVIKYNKPGRGILLAGVPNFTVEISVFDLSRVLGSIDHSRLYNFIPTGPQSVILKLLASLKGLKQTFPDNFGDVVEETTLSEISVDMLLFNEFARRTVSPIGSSSVCEWECLCEQERKGWGRELLDQRKGHFGSEPVVIWGKAQTERCAILLITHPPAPGSKVDRLEIFLLPYRYD